MLHEAHRLVGVRYLAYECRDAEGSSRLLLIERVDVTEKWGGQSSVEIC
jgi:hypothetical protein